MLFVLEESLVTEIHFPRLFVPCYVSAHNGVDCEVWRSQSVYTTCVCVCVCVCIHIHYVCVFIYSCVQPDEGLLGQKMYLKITE